MKKIFPIVIASLLSVSVTVFITYRIAQKLVPSQLDKAYHSEMKQVFDFGSGDIFLLQRIKIFAIGSVEAHTWVILGSSPDSDLPISIDILNENKQSILKYRAATRRPTQDPLKYSFETTIGHWPRSDSLTVKATLLSTGQSITRKIPNPIIHFKFYDMLDGEQTPSNFHTSGILRKPEMTLN